MDALVLPKPQDDRAAEEKKTSRIVASLQAEPVANALVGQQIDSNLKIPASVFSALLTQALQLEDQRILKQLSSEFEGKSGNQNITYTLSEIVQRMQNFGVSNETIDLIINGIEDRAKFFTSLEEKKIQLKLPANVSSEDLQRESEIRSIVEQLIPNLASLRDSAAKDGRAEAVKISLQGGTADMRFRLSSDIRANKEKIVDPPKSRMLKALYSAYPLVKKGYDFLYGKKSEYIFSPALHDLELKAKQLGLNLVFEICNYYDGRKVEKINIELPWSGLKDPNISIRS